LAKDHDTGESKGFAFINYVYREDAQVAMEKLNGKGFGYLILALEWAKYVSQVESFTTVC